MEISVIAAMGVNREIGKDNDLMWHLPNDMKFFKETTKGHHIIMGPTHYESIPLAFRPFKNRVNIILSRDKDYDAPDCVVFDELSRALGFAREGGETEAFIIGGEQIYAWALREGFVQHIYLTHIEGEFPGAHAHFPEFDASLYTRELILEQEVDEKHKFAFKTYKYTLK
jgi:dihydrofolate reductase